MSHPLFTRLLDPLGTDFAEVYEGVLASVVIGAGVVRIIASADYEDHLSCNHREGSRLCV